MKRAKPESSSPCNKELLHSNPKRLKYLAQEEDYNYNLLNLSDDVLLNIFKYLSSFDLLSLHLCCLRLCDLCRDRTLWKSIDLRGKHLPFDELKEYVKFLQPVTKFLALRGNKRKNELPELMLSFLKIINKKCTQLEDFILEEYSISREKIQITNFPTTLKKLSLQSSQLLKGNIVQVEKSYLYKIDDHMPNLTTLILTNCDWLNSHSFIAISKIRNLKEVRLNSCHGLDEEIAYASLACRYGLKSLELLDLRDTFVGDSVISSFSHTSTLTEMYLECPGDETAPHPPNDNLQLIEQNPEHRYIVFQDNQIAMVNENEYNHLFRNIVNNADRFQVSDRSLCTLGLCSNENNEEIINLREEVQLVQGRARTLTNPKLKKLVVRNYAGVTNQTLLHFTVNGRELKYLDVTGTSVTKEGLQNFKLQRPDVTIISSFEEI
ncbi:uncharacterized protein LOC106643254 [Copidosoma floridanum]|uniref:uncharacterized protein LOC106643254 n=1 Tax=Copidosoma floridanum TaxID=29053 RepID=UPI0006C9773C|nr:uncharacterized protein LOC106643254 [Copidosoma floridanum]